MTYDQWKDTHRHAHRIEFMRDYDVHNYEFPALFEDWLRRKYQTEFPTEVSESACGLTGDRNGF